MNVLLTNATEFYSGGELFVLQVATELKRRGYGIVVSAQPGHLLLEKCAAAGIVAEPVRYGKTFRHLKAIPELRSLVKRHRIDLVHSNADFDRTWAGFAAWTSGLPHVANIHSQQSIQYNILHWTRNKYAVSHFLVDGEPTKKILVERDRIPADKITVLRLGIDITGLGPDPITRMEVRRELSIPEDAVVCGNVARMVPFKGHAFLLAATKQVLSVEKRAIFLMIGDGPIREEIERQARDLGIGESVRFLGFRDDLPRLYAAMDIYTHPSLDDGGESFPLAVLQALASGLPVVASEAGDIPLMLDEERNGKLVHPGDAAELAAVLLNYFENDALRRDAGGRGAEYVRARFTTQRMVDAIEEVYRRVRTSV